MKQCGGSTLGDRVLAFFSFHFFFCLGAEEHLPLCVNPLVSKLFMQKNLACFFPWNYRNKHIIGMAEGNVQ